MILINLNNWNDVYLPLNQFNGRLGIGDLFGLTSSAYYVFNIKNELNGREYTFLPSNDYSAGTQLATRLNKFQLRIDSGTASIGTQSQYEGHIGLNHLDVDELSQWQLTITAATSSKPEYPSVIESGSINIYNERLIITKEQKNI